MFFPVGIVAERIGVLVAQIPFQTAQCFILFAPRGNLRLRRAIIGLYRRRIIAVQQIDLKTPVDCDVRVILFDKNIFWIVKRMNKCVNVLQRVGATVLIF